MSMYHISKHSGVGQLSTVDADGILRLFTDSVAAYVENTQPDDARQRRDAATGAGVETHNPLNSVSHQVGVAGQIMARCSVQDIIPDNDRANTTNCTKLPDQSQIGTVSAWEDARQRNATERGYEYVAPNSLPPGTVVRSEPDTDCLRTDGELSRMCGLGFKHYVQYERWLILHDMSRAGGQGFTFDELYTRSVQLGCKGSATHLRRIIRKGIGFYWEYDPRTDTIYPTGYVELCKRAIQYAHDLGLHDLYLYGNHPGQRRDMYISVSGNAGDFEAQILASWYGLHGCPTISRFSLSAITGRDARSIRRMERRACITITYNEAQTTDPAAVPLNADGSLRGDVRYENGVWSSRMPNTYTPRMTRQHHRRGQGRKAACWFKHWLSSDRLPGRPQANIAISDMGKLNCIWRTYCETDKALNASLKRGVLTTLYVATGRQHKGRVWKVAKNEDIYD